jgi:hypothetical protein
MDIKNTKLNFGNTTTDYLNNDRVESNKSNNKVATNSGQSALGFTGRTLNQNNAEAPNLNLNAKTNSQEAKLISERLVTNAQTPKKECPELDWTQTEGIPDHYCFSKSELPYSAKKLEAACNKIETTLKSRLEELKEDFFGKKDNNGKYTNASQKITAQQLQKLKNFNDTIYNWGRVVPNYLVTYRELLALFLNPSDSNKKFKALNISYILEKLCDFAIEFQHIHELEATYHADIQAAIEVSAPVAYIETLPIFQKSWALYLKAYEQHTGKKIRFSGILEEFRKISFVNPLERVHLFYTRNNNGFLLSDFISHDHFKIQDNLYKRIISYSKDDQFKTNCRMGLFYNDGNNFQLVENAMVEIKKISGTSELVNVCYYTGKERNVALDLSPNTSIKFYQPVHEILKAERYMQTLFVSANSSANNTESLYTLPVNLSSTLPTEINAAIQLGISELFDPTSTTNHSIIIPVLNKLEKQEAYYVYLLGILESSKKRSIDPEVQKTIAYIEAYHQDKPLGAIVEKLEENLELEYTLTYLSENESEIEATIRKEQEARRDAVARGDNYNVGTSKKQSRAKNKQAKKGIQKAANDKESSVIEVTDKYRVASRNAKSKLKALKESVLKQPTWKYRQFTKLLNQAGKALQPLGINMGGEIDRGSHGHLSLINLNNTNNNTATIKETVVKPHGGAPVIHKSRFLDLLDSINDAI